MHVGVNLVLGNNLCLIHRWGCVTKKLCQSQACLELAKQIFLEEFLTSNPKRFQDALSDPRHKFLFFLAVIWNPFTG